MQHTYRFTAKDKAGSPTVTGIFKTHREYSKEEQTIFLTEQFSHGTISRDQIVSIIEI